MASDRTASAPDTSPASDAGSESRTPIPAVGSAPSALAVRPRIGLLALALGLAATLIALTGSWIPSLWGDEAASLMASTRPLPSLFTMLGHVDAVHGTYYLGLHVWIDMFGTSPFSIRLPSALAVGATVCAVVLIADRLSTPTVAVVAGVVCCVLPRVTYMGEEARSFAFSAAIAAWLTLILIELLRRQRPPLALWIAYGLLLVLGIYVFLYLALFVLVHALILARAHPPRPMVWAWLATSAGALLLAGPLFVLAFFERAQISYLSTDSEVGFTTLTVGLWFGEAWFAVVAWLLIGVALGVRMRQGWLLRHSRLSTRSRPTGGGGPPRRQADEGTDSLENPQLPSLEFVAASWLFVPTAFLVLMNLVFAGFTGRYSSYSAPAAALLMASGLVWLGRNRRWRILVGTLLIIALAVPIYWEQRGPHAKNDSDWAAVSAVVETHAMTGDAVVFDETVRPSRRPRLAMHAYPAGFVGLRDVALDIPAVDNNTWYDRAYPIETAIGLGRLEGMDRVWLINYSDPGHTDVYAVSALTALGLTATDHFRTHRSVITLYVLPSG
ncbi:glycosyltransferase family 39 protein [Leifsonia kafniensis]|uniref:Glycosyltransferase family 39 protein n=1 Tax=Leifsonia kafniensis TaxID=475957 RepID=A0ABP7L425_9MICO